MPDSTIALDHMLTNMAKLVENLRVFPDRMKANLDMTHGLIHSQQVLLLLTEKGFARDEAYRLVQVHAMAAWETGRELKALVAADPVIMARVSPAELEKVFDLAVHFRDVNRTFKAVGL